MHMIDIRGIDGPYWAAWREYCAREDVFSSASYVPEWFLIRLMQERLAVAREQLEGLGAPAMDVFANPTQREMTSAWRALEVLEQFIAYGSQADPVGAREQVLAALLGAVEREYSGRSSA